MRVDVAALRAAADQFDSIAQLLADAIARTRAGFGGGCAGRAHVADGDAVARGVDRRAGDLAQWLRAAQEIAVGLRDASTRHLDAAQLAGSRIG